MARILLRLRMAPEDEAQDVRELLDTHRIPWFETSAGRFGASFPALWLQDDEDWEKARALLDDYQAKRQAEARATFKKQQEDGHSMTFLSRLLSHPIQMVLILAAVSAIVYFSVVPFFSLLSG